MKIETTTKLSHPTLILRGDFDTDGAARFLEAIEQIRQGGDARVMVSLRYVKYLNSTALGAVVRARTSCREANGDLVILQPSRLSRETITKMGLENVLRIFDDDVEAARYLAGESIVDAAAPPPDANEDSNKTVVMFSFDDERSALIPGKSRHGVATLDSVDASSIVFRWNPEAHDSDATTAASMFVPGSKMRNKLQIKMLRKGFFEGESTVDNLVSNAIGDVIVTARWSRITESDRAELMRYQEDIDFLRKQAQGEAAG